MSAVVFTKCARLLSTFARDQRGAVLVEFAICLPVMLLFFAIIVESANTFWTYQMAISGVRDANRYMSRVLPLNSCTTVTTDANGNITTQSIIDNVTDIVNDDYANAGTTSVFSDNVTVNSVTPSLDCSAPDNVYRNGRPAILTVTANITLDFPLGFIFGFFGDELGSATFEVADSARVFGQ